MSHINSRHADAVPNCPHRRIFAADGALHAAGLGRQRGRRLRRRGVQHRRHAVHDAYLQLQSRRQRARRVRSQRAAAEVRVQPAQVRKRRGTGGGANPRLACPTALPHLMCAEGTHATGRQLLSVGFIAARPPRCKGAANRQRPFLQPMLLSPTSRRGSIRHPPQSDFDELTQPQQPVRSD